MEEKKKIGNGKLLLIAIVLILVVIIGTTYAWLRITKESNVVNKITAGNLELTLDDKASEGIKLLKAIPMSYQQGIKTEEYTFTLTNTSSTSSYTLSLKDLTTYTNDNDEEVTITDADRLGDSKVRYILLKDGEEATASKSKILTDRVIDSGTIEEGKTITYSLRIWMDSKAGDDNSEAEVMKKIFNAQLSLEATQASQTKSVSFIADSWSTIAANVKAGTISAYQVGDTKTVDMGNLGTHTLRVVNTSACTNGETSETTCGFVVEFADVISKQKVNLSSTNFGGWPASAVRTYVNGTVYNSLPSELQKVITTTAVVSSHGSTSGETNFTSSDKLYLFSTKEVWGKDGTSRNVKYDTAEVETRQLDYYKNKGITTSNYSGAIKKYNGSDCWWWLRSASSNSSNSFFYVDYRGFPANNYVTNLYGVSPAFRIA
mgnify:CR=1 FL=1